MQVSLTFQYKRKLDILYQALGNTVNRVGAAASSAGAYVYIHVYNAVLYEYFLHILNFKVPLSGPQNQYFDHIMHSITVHKTSCTYTHL